MTHTTNRSQTIYGKIHSSQKTHPEPEVPQSHPMQEQPAGLLPQIRHRLRLLHDRLGSLRKRLRPHAPILYIGGTDTLPEPLSTDEERRCLIVLAGVRPEEADAREQARKQLISHNLRLVVYLAKKFENTGINVEDLISIGTIGLIKGINTFNPDKKIKLATYASRCIENEILMYLRRNSRTRLEVSIDEPLNVDWDGNELLLSDILGTEEDAIGSDLESAAELQVLRTALGKLDERESEIIELRYGLRQPNQQEMTQKEVADRLGISQSYISRLEKKIMQRLKKEILRYT